MIEYKKRRKYKYNLHRDYLCATGIAVKEAIDSGLLKMTEEGELTICKGYAWDGPSGPAIDTKNFMRGSLVHDALYQLLRAGLLPREMRKEADLLMMKICREAGMSRFRSRYLYWGVRLFSGWAARNDLKTAP